MTNQSELLPILSELAGYVEFDVKIGFSCCLKDIDYMEEDRMPLEPNTVSFKGSSTVYLIPSVEWLEDKAVEMDRLVDTDFYFTVDYYECNGTWNYTWGDKVQEPDDVPRICIQTQHKDRTTAIASLLLKLCKEKS